MSNKRTWKNIEVRLNDDDSADEVIFKCGKKVLFHLEQMDYGEWWIGLTEDKQTCHINLSTKRNVPITVSVESEDGKLSCGFESNRK